MSDTIRDALAEAIRRAINTNSAENASNTPDYILAQFMCACLVAFDTATQQRETWYGRDARPSSAALAAPPAPSVPREPTKAMIDAAANMHFEMAAHCSRGPDYPDVWRAMWDAAQPDNDQTGREGNKAGTSAEQSTHGCKAPTQGEFAEYLAPDPTAAPAQERDWATINSVCDDGQAAPAQGEPQDYDSLVARLRATRMDRDNFPRMDSERWLPVGLAREAADAIDALRAERDALECANASLNVEVDRLYACRNELQEVTRTMNDPTINIIHTLNEAVHSLRAERDALREALQAAAKAMNDECLYYAQYGEQPPQHILDALDAASAKVKL